MPNLIIAAILSYLIGSIPSGFILGKLIKKIDIRKHGSGNLGASNVFRTLGPKWGVLTLILDLIKGLVCVIFISKLVDPAFIDINTVKVLFGVCAVVGHIWTIFLKFKGGKGVATATGVFLGLCWQAVLFAFILFVIIVYFSKYISLGSICAAVVFPILIKIFSDVKLFFILSIVLSAVIVLKHRANVKRIILGTENRFNWARR